MATHSLWNALRIISIMEHALCQVLNFSGIPNDVAAALLFFAMTPWSINEENIDIYCLSVFRKASERRMYLTIKARLQNH